MKGAEVPNLGAKASRDGGRGGGHGLGLLPVGASGQQKKNYDGMNLDFVPPTIPADNSLAHINELECLHNSVLVHHWHHVTIHN